MRHEVLTQRALFVLESMQKGHAESAFCDVCRTSSELQWKGMCDGHFQMTYQGI